MSKQTDRSNAAARKPVSRRTARFQRAVKDEADRLELAQKIYDVRESLGLRVRAFAKRIGVHDTALSRLERADYTGQPSVRTLAKIAIAGGRRLRIDFVEIDEHDGAQLAATQRDGLVGQKPKSGRARKAPAAA